MRGACLAAALLVCACGTAADMERRQARHFLSTAPLPDGDGPASIVQTVRILGDEDLRRDPAWEERAREMVQRTSALLQQEVGVRLEVAEVRLWARSGPVQSLDPLLDVLRRTEDPRPVDLVVAITGASPIASGFFHQLGVTDMGGHHIVLRAIDDAGEIAVLEETLRHLEPAERSAIYAHRRAHKETLLLAHEWGHTQGAPHSEEPGDIMAPVYDPQSAHFGPAAKARVMMALAGRAPVAPGPLTANDLGDRLAAMERTGASCEIWLALAERCAEAGALSCAEEAAARAGSEPARQLAQDILRRRERLGLPHDAARYKVTPDREPAFAELVRKEAALLHQREARQARREIEEALQRFPEAPGLLGLLCEAQLQLGHRRDAARTCDRALAEQEDFALGHLWAGQATGDRGEAVQHFRRAIDLAPELPQAWLELEEIYRRSGDADAVRALREERRRVLGASP